MEYGENNNPVSMADTNPMFGLNYLKTIHEGLPDFKDLKNEYLQDKYSIAF